MSVDTGVDWTIPEDIQEVGRQIAMSAGLEPDATEPAVEATAEPAESAEAAPEPEPAVDYESKYRESQQKNQQYEQFWQHGDGSKAWAHYQESLKPPEEPEVEVDPDDWELLDAVQENRQFRGDANQRLSQLEARATADEDRRMRREIEGEIEVISGKYADVDQQKLLTHYANSGGKYSLDYWAGLLFSEKSAAPAQDTAPPRENITSATKPAPTPIDELLGQMDGSSASWDAIEKYGRAVR